MKTVGWQ